MQLLLLSNSRQAGMGYLEHADGFLRAFLPSGIRQVLFVPYAAITKTHYEYVDEVRPAFARLGAEVIGIHRAHDPVQAVREAQAIVVGGGNTWNLLREMRGHRLLPVIRQSVLAGVPYIGWSAGTNVACPTIMTTNDMPICDPGGFDALALVPFQINPHYLHGNPEGFKGETREERIREFGVLHPSVPGSPACARAPASSSRIDRYGCWAIRSAASFAASQEPRELTSADDFSFLHD